MHMKFIQRSANSRIFNDPISSVSPALVASTGSLRTTDSRSVVRACTSGVSVGLMALVWRFMNPFFKYACTVDTERSTKSREV